MLRGRTDRRLSRTLIANSVDWRQPARQGNRLRSAARVRDAAQLVAMSRDIRSLTTGRSQFITPRTWRFVPAKSAARRRRRRRRRSDAPLATAWYEHGQVGTRGALRPLVSGNLQEIDSPVAERALSVKSTCATSSTRSRRICEVWSVVAPKSHYSIYQKMIGARR